jgi:hypothetical protein
MAGAARVATTAPAKSTAPAAAQLPALSTISGGLTPQLYQSIADQLRSGTDTVRVLGKQYKVYDPGTRQTIMARYPAPEGAPPQTRAEAPVSTTPPELTAQSVLAQIDPYSEQARQRLAQEMADPQAAMKSYLNIYGQVDPAGLAARQELERQVGGDLALGATLDPTTQMQIEQASRAAQGARGNVYGVAPQVQEALTQGQAGLALRQARQQAAQSYLASGTDPGSVALSLMRNQQAAVQSYLGSGQTPYQAGAGYLGNVQAQAGAAAQGGPQYQPAALGSPYSYMQPNYGLQMGNEANQWYNSLLSQYGMGMAGQTKNPWMGAGLGAASGALSGALTGSAAGPGWGTLVGAGIGAAAGGLKGWAS